MKQPQNQQNQQIPYQGNQQNPYQQNPQNQQVPYQQYQQFNQQPPKKKKKKWPIILGIVGVISVIGIVSDLIGGDDDSTSNTTNSNEVTAALVQTTEAPTTIETTIAETTAETIPTTTKELTQEEINRELVDDFSPNVLVAADNVLEDIYGKAIDFKLFDDRTVAVYKSGVAVDIEGKEYPLSFSISGESETESGDILEYMMCVGYRTEEEIKSFQPTLLEFLDYRTGDMYINVPDDESVIKSFLEMFSEPTE